MSTLTEFLFPTPARRSTLAIIGWWERRRIAYNLWVGAAGAVSLGMVSAVVVSLGGAVMPTALGMGALVFGGMANVCYLLGPTAEILVAKVWGRQVLPIGPALFRMGLTFSVGLALFPALLAALLLVVRIALTVV